MIIVDGYTIDAALHETHVREAEVSDYEVESGADVTDHVRNHPVSLEIEGLVSDTPIGAIASTRANATGSSSSTGELLFLPSEEAFARLEEIFGNREPVTIETSTKTYESMILVNLEVPIDAQTGDALRFTASFRELRLVKVNRTAVRVATPTAAGKSNRGNQPGKAGQGIGYDYAKSAILTDGPDRGGYFTKPDGTPWTGVRWDPKTGSYVSADGNPLVSPENVTYFDDSKNHFVNTDGTPVTRDQMTSALTDTGGTVPWWLQ